ncbi:MAG: hypothetical protein FD167_360 [bacterium]|nr:MAG: hypothetical protein FD167_360 [bacterium]
MLKDVDPKVTKEQLLKQLDDAVKRYKAAKAIGKENISQQTFENKQKTIPLASNRQKRLEMLKALKST